MNSKFLSLIAGVSALALAGAVQAAEPVNVAASMQLSAAQMDSVTAAGHEKTPVMKPGKPDDKKHHDGKHRAHKPDDKKPDDKKPDDKKPTIIKLEGSADASADATAVGQNAVVFTKTDAEVIVGATSVTATASSQSSAFASSKVAAPKK